MKKMQIKIKAQYSIILSVIIEKEESAKHKVGVRVYRLVIGTQHLHQETEHYVHMLFKTALFKEMLTWEN